MKNFHELLNLSKPSCLWCKDERTIVVKQNAFCKSINCTICNNFFSICYSHSNINRVKDIIFTCDDWYFYYIDTDDCYTIENYSYPFLKFKIPIFEIDFSNKQVLIDKMKTLELFS